MSKREKKVCDASRDDETEFDSKMTAIGNRLDELVGEMDKSAEAGAAARQTGDSYATGLRNKYDEVYNAGAALASAAKQRLERHICTAFTGEARDPYGGGLRAGAM